MCSRSRKYSQAAAPYFNHQRPLTASSLQPRRRRLRRFLREHLDFFTSPLSAGSSSSASSRTSLLEDVARRQRENVWKQNICITSGTCPHVVEILGHQSGGCLDLPVPEAHGGQVDEHSSTCGGSAIKERDLKSCFPCQHCQIIQMNLY